MCQCPSLIDGSVHAAAPGVVIFAILTLQVYSWVCDLFHTSSSPYCRNIWIWTDLRLHHRERVPRRRVRAPLAVAVTIRYHRSYPLLPRTWSPNLHSSDPALNTAAAEAYVWNSSYLSKDEQSLSWKAFIVFVWSPGYRWLKEFCEVICANLPQWFVI